MSKWIQVTPEIENSTRIAREARETWRRALAENRNPTTESLTLWGGVRIILMGLAERVLDAPIVEFGGNEPEEGCCCHEIGSRCCDLHNGNCPARESTSEPELTAADKVDPE
jgi:hypothetical protein